jgi:hypothetical protein
MSFKITNRLVLGAFLLVSFGCASIDAVQKNYDAMVDMKDGVSEHEAKLIAQKEILNVQEKRDYRITAPDIKTTEAASKYPMYWFVVFGHNWFSPISMDPTAKTYTELREAQYVVVIDKLSGEIKFSGQWFQKRQNNFDWVFNPEAYREGNRLALPPYEKGTPLF